MREGTREEAASAIFSIEELPHTAGVRLALIGELDLATAPALDRRLEQLRARGTTVLLDLSRLDFIDSTGMKVLIRAWGHRRNPGWSFEIDPQMAPQTMRLFKLVGAERMIVGEGGTER